MTQVYMFIHNRLTQHVLGFIMPIVSQENRLYKTACGVSLDVLAVVVWSWDTSSAFGSFFSCINDARSHEPEDYQMCCRISVTCRFKVCLRSGIIFIDWHFVSSSLIKI